MPSDLPPSIEALFQLIASQAVTGDAAKLIVRTFLYHHRLIDDNLLDDLASDKSGETAANYFGIFCRLLDRNLVAGFGAKTIMTVPWLNEPQSSNPTAVDLTSVDTNSPSRNLLAFSCALGISIVPPFTALNIGEIRWFASRKVDGVRVLSLIDIIIPSSSTAALECFGVSFISRSGMKYSSLSNLGDQLRHITKYPRLREWLDRDPTVITRTEGGIVKRLVLDGEVSMMRRMTEEESSQRQAWSLSGLKGAAALGEEEDNLVEDFAKTVSVVRRRDTIPHPRYFVFDTVSWIELISKGTSGGPGLGKTFGQRIPDSKDLVEFLTIELQNQGVTEKMVRVLAQWEIQYAEDVDEMAKRAAEEGWEGLIFRADKPYKGKRSWVLLSLTTAALVNQGLSTGVISVSSKNGRTVNTS